MDDHFQGDLDPGASEDKNILQEMIDQYRDLGNNPPWEQVIVYLVIGGFFLFMLHLLFKFIYRKAYEQVERSHFRGKLFPKK